MLLIDGVKYEWWAPPSEDEFEQMVKEHARDIFGEHSVYLDLKQKLRSKSGIGSIPDGYVIVFAYSPCWYVVEIELSSHPIHDHIVPQISKLNLGTENPVTRNEIRNVVYEEILKDNATRQMLKSRIGSREIHEFLSKLISKPPKLALIIDKETEELKDTVKRLRLEMEIRVVQFQTLVREDNKAQHAHLFEPVHEESDYRDFLSEIKQGISNRRPELKPAKSTYDNLFQIATGHQGIHLECLVHDDKQELGVELHMERKSKTENSKVLRKLQLKSSELETRIGEKLVFDPDWYGIYRVYCVKKLQTPETKEWAVTTMIKFYDVFKPMLDKID